MDSKSTLGQHRKGLRPGFEATLDAHRLCRLIWKILHEGVRYDERGPEVSRARTQRRALKMIRELRSLGYRVDLIPSPPGTPA